MTKHSIRGLVRLGALAAGCAAAAFTAHAAPPAHPTTHQLPPGLYRVTSTGSMAMGTPGAQSRIGQTQADGRGSAVFSTDNGQRRVAGGAGGPSQICVRNQAPAPLLPDGARCRLLSTGPLPGGGFQRVDECPFGRLTSESVQKSPTTWETRIRFGDLTSAAAPTDPDAHVEALIRRLPPAEQAEARAKWAAEKAAAGPAPSAAELAQMRAAAQAARPPGMPMAPAARGDIVIVSERIGDC